MNCGIIAVVVDIILSIIGEIFSTIGRDLVAIKC